MLTLPEKRLSASNAAVVSSSFFVLPVTIRFEAKDSSAAVQKVAQVVALLRSDSSMKEEGVTFVPYEEPISPRKAHVDLVKRGKEVSFTITFCIRDTLPAGSDFWTRLALIAARFEKLTKFATTYEDDKGLDIFLEQAQLEHQKEEPEGVRFAPK